MIPELVFTISGIPSLVRNRVLRGCGLVLENSPESPLPVDKSHGGCRAGRRRKPQERLSVAGRPMEIGRPFKRCERRVFGWGNGIYTSVVWVTQSWRGSSGFPGALSWTPDCLAPCVRVRCLGGTS